MIYSISNCRRHTYQANLTNTFGTERIYNLIFFFNKNYIEIMHVGMNGNMVLSKILIHILP